MQGFVVEAGGSGLAADGVFNNAYVLATEDSDAARARIAEFNGAFTAWYGEAARPGRTARPGGGAAASRPRKPSAPSMQAGWLLPLALLAASRPSGGATCASASSTPPRARRAAPARARPA